MAEDPLVMSPRPCCHCSSDARSAALLCAQSLLPQALHEPKCYTTLLLPAVALSYSAQLLGEVPVDGHDRAVDMIILPEGILGCTDQDRSNI